MIVKYVGEKKFRMAHYFTKVYKGRLHVTETENIEKQDVTSGFDF